MFKDAMYITGIVLLIGLFFVAVWWWQIPLRKVVRKRREVRKMKDKELTITAKKVQEMARACPEAREVLKRYDLPTIFFLAGIFILADMMFKFGWIGLIARGIKAVVGDNPFFAYTLIVWFSVIVSAFIDNIAYIALMLPVASELAATIGGHPFLYAGGLLVGSCLGGNITPFGASANVVAVGLLRKEGYTVSTGDFVRIGLPFTLAATTAGAVFLWLTWR